MIKEVTYTETIEKIKKVTVCDICQSQVSPEDAIFTIASEKGETSLNSAKRQNDFHSACFGKIDWTKLR